MTTSEFRSYGFILDSLAALGWNRQPPSKGGQVYTQNEVSRDVGLKSVLGQQRPENVVVVDNNPKRYWVIEAKADLGAMPQAIDEAKEYADLINRLNPMICRLVTGVVGDPDSAHLVETQFLSSSGDWEPLTINARKATGFISPEQAKTLLSTGSGALNEYDIDDTLFIGKTEQINKILHTGGVNKRNRAAVLASLLLAIASEPHMSLSSTPRTMIRDINARAEERLREYGKDNFFGEIEINLPTSDDNHVKHRKALVDTIDVLRGLNIASAINSGRDVLGQFYEQFLKYAHDAKELGIVLTPRHITTFAANVVNVQASNVVFDPACGTGGFLVAALDKVRHDIDDVSAFKEGHLHGVEQDPLIAALAIVNMIFRGDGSSNIQEGDGLKADPKCEPDRCLMNPPFALEDEFEWKFVDRGLELLKPGGLLFSVLPTTTVMSANDRRQEFTWRSNMLKRHTLLAVVKLPEDLFYPHVSKGTCGVLIRAHRPHDMANGEVVWAVLDDGLKRTKTSQTSHGNLEMVERSLRHFVTTGTRPDFVPEQIDCTQIRTTGNNILDLSPENHIGRSGDKGRFDLQFLSFQLQAARHRIQKSSAPETGVEDECQPFSLMDFVARYERGKSGRLGDMHPGALPLISTSETDNGICATVDHQSVGRVYKSGTITVSSNGASCCAFYHDYEFAANPDVYVLELREQFKRRDFSLFLCAAINNESWRYNYFRKFNQTQLENLTVQIPVRGEDMDFGRITRLVHEAGLAD